MPPAGTPAAADAKRFAAPAEPVADPAKPASGEAKPADAPAKTGEAAPAEAAKPEEWTLAAPKDVTVAEPTLKAVESFAKEHKLGKDVAEKILARDLAAETARIAAVKAENDTIGKTWYDQSMAHPELGGANAKQSEALVNKAMLAFLPADMRKLVYDSAFIANPIFRLFAHNAAKLIPVEDGVPPLSTKPPATPKSPAERIYGKL